MSETRWLDPHERRTWLDLLVFVTSVPAAVESQLQSDAGLSLFEYLVLARLSEQPQHTVQLKELAVLAGGSLSRLSHVLTRLEKRGYLQRSPSPTNGRITLATLTDTGLDAVVAVAPRHVETVRAVVFDRLTPDEVTQLGAITAKLNLR